MNLKEAFEQLAQSQPKQRKHPSEEEHNIQCNCVKWFRLKYRRFAHNLFAVPNGGWRNRTVAAKLKGEGVLAGVSDLIFLKSNVHYGALLIEMKREKGKQSDAQREWQRLMEADGFKYVVCRSLDDFMREIDEYIADCD